MLQVRRRVERIQRRSDARAESARRGEGRRAQSHRGAVSHVIHILNLIFGFIPTLILGPGIAAGVDDDRDHRRIFVLVYGLWAITLAMWNWMRSAPAAWIIIWSIA